MFADTRAYGALSDGDDVGGAIRISLLINPHPVPIVVKMHHAL